MSIRCSLWRFAAPTACLLLAGGAQAGGLYAPVFGTPSNGTSNAGAEALAADASTAFLNPAGMTRLGEHQLVGTLAPGFTTIEFDVDKNPVGGGDGGQQGSFLPISSAQYAHALSERWRLGLSLISLGGAGLDPNNGWAGRNELTEVSLFTVSLAPTVGVKVCDWLSVGGGMVVSYGSLGFKLRLPFERLGEPPLKVTGMDDIAVAPIASILLEPLENLRIGVLYLGETDFHLEGKGRLKGLKTDLSLQLPLAQIVKVGFAYEPTQRITLLGSVGWEDWSTAKDLPVSAPGGSASVPLGFRDTWYMAGGVQVRLGDTWAVQTGLRYDSSALKDSKRTVAFPIDRSFTTSFGVTQEWSDNLRLAYAFTWVDLGNAPVNTPFVKGDYRKNALFTFGVSLIWKQLPWNGWATL